MWGRMGSTRDVRVVAVSDVLIKVVFAMMLIRERPVGLTGRLRDWEGPHAADR